MSQHMTDCECDYCISEKAHCLSLDARPAPSELDVLVAEARTLADTADARLFSLIHRLADALEKSQQEREEYRRHFLGNNAAYLSEKGKRIALESRLADADFTACSAVLAMKAAESRLAESERSLAQYRERDALNVIEATRFASLTDTPEGA